MRSRLTLGALALTAIWACGRPREVQLFVAASVSDLAADWQSDIGSRIRFDVHSGGSLVLARQILSGAQADLFLPAGLSALALLQNPGRVERVDSQFIENHLVVVCRSGLAPPQRVEEIADERFQRIALADPDLAPAGSYARSGLVAAGLWTSLTEHLVYAGDVRSALVAVVTGAADLGFVYATDARTQPQLQILNLDDRFPVAYYPLVKLHGASPAADSLWILLHTGDARRSIVACGFR